jgi:creatinine amidohydrolase
MRLDEMTWPEIKAAIAGGRTRVVFACGATEQHGPHLPLKVDALIGTALAEAVADRLDAFAAPTLHVGCSRHHMDFPGTLTLTEPTFKAVVREHCDSLRAHGFTEILVIPSHGGNFRPLAELVPELPGVQTYTDLEGMIGAWEEIIVAAGGPAGHVGGHADIAEASMILALRPELVRAAEAAAGYTGDPQAVLSRIFTDGFASVTANGVLGDPAGMSPELGRALLDGMAERIAAHFAG